ncbi:hypothetical protein J8A87_22635 [Vibrio parahaemolyticus]|nr:hypothetical protein [Vibrio parahaemolyticus]
MNLDLINHSIKTLSSNIHNLERKYKVFINAFNYSEDSVASMNRIDDGSLFLIRKSLLDSIILSVASLSDPANTGKNKNLSAKGVLKLIEMYFENDDCEYYNKNKNKS